MPAIVQLGANLLWVVLALGVIVDSVLISRKVKRLVRERFPKTDAADGLALPLRDHARRSPSAACACPSPRVKIGDKNI